MNLKQYKTLKVLGSLGLAGLLLLSMGLSLGLAQEPFTKTRVTTSSDGADRDSAHPSMSANGTKVAFFSDSDFLSQGIIQGQYEIWLYDTATMTLTRVTTASDGTDRRSLNPNMSADGTKVAFHSDSDFLAQGIANGQYEIWLYDTATMTVTRVTTSSDGAKRSSRFPNVSADGTRVAFQSDSDFLGQGIADEQYEIWLYDTDMMTLTRVTTSSAGVDPGSFNPTVNTNGTKVAFSSDADFLSQGIADDQYEIWLYDTDMMTLTRVTTSSDGANRSSFDPSLNADGTKIVFYSDSDFLGQGILQGQEEIWLYDTTAMTLTRITTSSDGANRGSFYPNLNANGTKIAFLSNSDFLSQGILQDQYEIWLYNTTTMTVTRVTSAPGGIGPFWVYFGPSLSADGSTVAFESDGDYLSQGIMDNQVEIWLFRSTQAILNLAKTVDDNSPEPGQVITYTVVAANTSAISATNLTISDTTPLSLTFISGSTTITPPGNGIISDAPTLVSGLTMTTGEQVTVTYQVTASLALTDGDVVTNTATLTGPDMIAPITATTAITIDSLIIIDPPDDIIYLPSILKN